MIGRKREQNILEDCLNSKRAEFLVVYGRRRIGKTYLIKKYFNENFSFYATGLSDAKMNEQLKIFNASLLEYGSKDKKIPKDWYEAFGRLKNLLVNGDVNKDLVTGKKVVFLDELPWMDTARSDFKSALEYFWNSWGSTQDDLLLIVCGSATSWIIDNLLGDRGGFYNRITRHIHLMPFSLAECEELYQMNGMVMSREQVVESYMIFGGVPYYLNCLDRRLSLAQNVEALLFNPNGQLYSEYERLLKSLFKKYEKHTAILDELANKKSGILRTELAAKKLIGDGAPLTKALSELEQSGFIRKYQNYNKEKSGYYYQLIDPFLLFCYRFVKNRQHESWMNYINTPGYYAWEGHAFELVSLLHTNQIKQSLGIFGVETSIYAWRSKTSIPGAQIDLVIDRKDGVINICEMKYSINPYEISAEYENELKNKVSVFVNETGCRKAVHLTMISMHGVVNNEHRNIVTQIIAGDDLFISI